MIHIIKKMRMTITATCLFFVSCFLFSCSAGSDLLDAVNDSRISGKNLHILVVAPFEHGSKHFNPSPLSRELQNFFIEGLNKLDEEYDPWIIRGQNWRNDKVTKIFYNALTDSRNRRNFLEKIIEDKPYNQVLFSSYLRGEDGNIGLRLYLYDKEDHTQGREPISGYRKIRWRHDRKDDAAEDVARVLRDLIVRYFTT